MGRRPLLALMLVLVLVLPVLVLLVLPVLVLVLRLVVLEVLVLAVVSLLLLLLLLLGGQRRMRQASPALPVVMPNGVRAGVRMPAPRLLSVAPAVTEEA